MEERFKLGATLCYDKEREQDIVDQLDSLKSRHKLGDFISNLIRIAFENPEEMRKLGLRIENYGLSDNRREFFKSVEDKVNEMSKKVDMVYDMAVKTYSLAMFNKKIGLEQKSTNLLQTQFVLQKQISELCATLGVSNLGHTFESNKIYNVAKNVDETLEFIINYYDGIVNEIKQNIVIAETPITTVESNTPVVNSEKDEIKTEKPIDSGSVEESDKPIPIVDTTEDDEVVDFGTGADLDLLSSFVNDF